MPSAATQPSTNHSSTTPPSSTCDPIPAPSLPILPSKTISGSNRVPSKPSESWETAYLFAFIYKFTSLCHTLKTGLKLRTVQDLERILETDTRESQSEPTGQTDSDQKDAKEILSAILVTFHDNLKTVNLNSWSKWLNNYVEEILKNETQKPFFSILKWPQNYLITRPSGFWDLDWLEKLHLLRILVDHQLTFSSKIRSIIEENYDKSSNKISKQQSTTSASNKVDGPKSIQNQLLIKPLGLDRNLKTWWQIDDSPRIYSSGNPYKADCTWTVLSTSHEELTELTNKLSVDPDGIQQQQSSNSIQTATVANQSSSVSRKVTIPQMFTKKSRKKKLVPQDLTLQLEYKLSTAITEIALPNIEAGEQRVQQLIHEKEKLEEREIRKQRKIALVNSRAPLTRDTPGFAVRSRLRSQLSKPDYVVDSDEIDRQLERVMRVSEGSKNGSSDSGRKSKSYKRKRKGRAGDSEDSDSDGSDYQTGSVAGTNEGDDTMGLDDSAELGRTARKRNSTGARKAVQTAQGERRSMRGRSTKVEIEAEEEQKTGVTEEEPQPQTSTWSRSKPAMSPSISDSLEESATEPTETNDNVSVWSRGKLIYVAGNNKYAAKPLLPPHENIKTDGEKLSSENEGKSTGVDGLLPLPAGIPTIGGVDDGDSSSEVKQKEDNSSAADQNRSGPSQLEVNVNQFTEPAHGLAAVHDQPVDLDVSVVSPRRSSPQLTQFDQENLTAPHPIIRSDKNNHVDLNHNTDPDLLQNRNSHFLSPIV